MEADDERPYNPPPTDPAVLNELRKRIDALKSSAEIAGFSASMLERRAPLPSEIRGPAYIKLLLGPKGNDYVLEREPSAEDFQRKALRAEQTCTDVEQVRLDVVRTRAKLEHFQSEHIRSAMMRLLCLFCAHERIAYLQGMNELIAPFMLLPVVGARPRSVFFLLRAFVRRKLPYVLCARGSRSSATSDVNSPRGNNVAERRHRNNSPVLSASDAGSSEECVDPFAGMRLCFQAFNTLLLYHDPELAGYLRANQVSCDFFATSWFITAFSRSLSLELVYALWDCMLLDARPCGLLYFALALLTSQREALLKTSSAMLPEKVTSLRPTTSEHIVSLWHRGADMRELCTPPSFTLALSKGIFDTFDPAKLVPVFSNPIACAIGCVVASVSDLNSHYRPGSEVDVAASGSTHSELQRESSDGVSVQKLSIFVLDCRTRDEYNAGHFPRSAYVRLDAVRALSNPQLQHQQQQQQQQQLQEQQQQQQQQQQQLQQQQQRQAAKHGVAESGNGCSNDTLSTSSLATGQRLHHINSDPRMHPAGLHGVNGTSNTTPRTALRSSARMASNDVDAAADQVHGRLFSSAKRFAPDHFAAVDQVCTPDEELSAAMELLRPLEGRVQLCLCGSGEISEDAADLAQLGNHLAHRLRVKYICVLHDGFQAMLREHLASTRARGGGIDALSAPAISRFELGAFKEQAFRAARAKRRLESEGASMPFGAKLSARLDLARAGAGASGNPWVALLERNQVMVSRLRGALAAMSSSFQTRFRSQSGSTEGGATPLSSDNSRVRLNSAEVATPQDHEGQGDTAQPEFSA